MEKHDVFIAYHLGPTGLADEKSSYYEAKGIKKLIEEELGYRCYLRNPIDATQTFQVTREIARSSKLFLLVINRNVIYKCIKMQQGNGKNYDMLSHDCYVYEEIQGFLNQFGGKTLGDAKGRIQCYCKEKDFSDYSINNLHVAFAQMVPLRDEENVIKWVNKKVNEDYIYSLDNMKIELVKKEWGTDIASVWSNIFPPSRPSKSEIECYRKYFRMVKKNANGNRTNVLILGSTIEFRQLAFEESFNTVVVDYNKDYYDAVSKELPLEIKERETLVVCDWADMLECEELQKNYFDIIIGDLAIGNIKPDKLDVTFNAITELLRVGGYLLGKNLYSFSRDNINDETIQKTIEGYFEEYNDESLNSAYAYTMYNLSIYATQEREDRKIDFEKIFKKVDEICKCLKRENSSIYEIYCGDNTSFKNKMQISFYTYPIHEIINKFQGKLFLTDTEYGQDVYSGKFPLIILKKIDFKHNNINFEKHNCFLRIKNYVGKLLKCDYLNEWAKYISAQYFLVKLSEMFENNNWKHIIKNIKELIIDTVKVGISEELVCHIESYYDQKIETETDNIKNVDKLVTEQNKLLGETYILAILVYLTSTLTKDYDDNNSLYTLVTEKLFSLPAKGELWKPEEAPWMRAKICLCVKKIYPNLSAKHKKLINDTIEWIMTCYDPSLSDWKCEVGSHVDTRALCCEVLILYYDIINEEFIKSNIIRTLSFILDSYVLNGKIYETFAMYPIGNGIINSIRNKEKLRNKSYVKKITSRIEFLTILLRLINFMKDNLEEFNYSLNKQINCQMEEEFLVKRLINFWNEFELNIDSLRVYFTEEEISSISQIIYSYAEAFL